MYVLDASALLAYLNEEPGADEVEAMLDDALISTVNLAEVLQKAANGDIDSAPLASEIARMGVGSVAFDPAMAVIATDLWPKTKHRGLSLADRACLAVAEATDWIVVTTDKAWADLDLPGINIHLIKR
ncbi:MAG: type II toxin-antitoxin system VapC family toxin [Lacisediminihabitans sp.]